MTPKNSFHVSAQPHAAQEYPHPPHALMGEAQQAQSMVAQAAFRSGAYEVHVFKAPDRKTHPATAEDVIFASPLPLFGGLEQDDMDAFKGPDERAEDARYSAQHAGRAVCVVVFDLDTQVSPIGLSALSQEENKVFALGAYEVHVNYPRGCTDKTVAAENITFQNEASLIGTEDHELNNVMDFDDRTAQAQRLFASGPQNGATRAVAFYVGHLGADALQTAPELARAVNQAAGTPTLKEQMAALANQHSQPQFKAWFKRLLGAQP